VIWRVVFENIASLQEIETFWSIDDLMEANSIIDYRETLQNLQNHQSLQSQQKNELNNYLGRPSL